jgi:hypothetical protein
MTQKHGIGHDSIVHYRAEWEAGSYCYRRQYRQHLTTTTVVKWGEVAQQQPVEGPLTPEALHNTTCTDTLHCIWQYCGLLWATYDKLSWFQGQDFVFPPPAMYATFRTCAQEGIPSILLVNQLILSCYYLIYIAQTLWHFKASNAKTFLRHYRTSRKEADSRSNPSGSTRPWGLLSL